MNQFETTIYDFKTHLSSYIKDLEAGKYDRIIVKRRDEAVGEFTLKKPDEPRGIKLGTLRGQLNFDKELFDSADKEIEEMFYGTSDDDPS